jgi:hypothetical protein
MKIRDHYYNLYGHCINSLPTCIVCNSNNWNILSTSKCLYQNAYDTQTLSQWRQNSPLKDDVNQPLTWLSGRHDSPFPCCFWWLAFLTPKWLRLWKTNSCTYSLQPNRLPYTTTFTHKEQEFENSIFISVTQYRAFLHGINIQWQHRVCIHLLYVTFALI